jgi:L-arabinonolactonase
MAHEPDVALDAKAGVGEGPVWVAEEQALYWTDIPGRTLNRFDPASGKNRSWPMPGRVGCFALRRVGGLIIAMEHGFAFVDLDTGKVEPICEPEADRPDNRFNDGRCDRGGRFLAASMHEPRRRDDGALYSLAPDLGWQRIAGGVVVGNGLAFSPDDRLMYWSDSRRRRVFLFDYDIETGEARNQRLWMETADALGGPDGAAIDAEGCYWSARFWGGRVIRFSPDGRIDREIHLPVRRVTMCAFGGPDLRTLYITTARQGMSAAELAKEPLAGAIFALDAGIAGLPEPRFAG